MTTLSAALGLSACAAQAQVVVLWDTGAADHVDATTSETMTAITNTAAADDFVLPLGTGEEYVLTEVTGWLVRSGGNPQLARLEIYDTWATGDTPAYVVRASVAAPTSVVDLGLFAPDIPGYRVYQTTFGNLRLTLPAGGRYWASVRGVGDGSHLDRALLATAGNGVVQGLEACVKAGPLGAPFWVPGSAFNLAAPSDYAIRVKGYQSLPTLWDTLPWSTPSGLSSTSGTGASPTRAADDVLTPGTPDVGQVWRVGEVVIRLATNANPTPSRLEIYADDGTGRPGAMVATRVGCDLAAPVGQNLLGVPIYELSFRELGIELEPERRYWVSVSGDVSGLTLKVAYAATTGNPNILGLSAMTRIGSGPWNPAAQTLGSPADLAFLMFADAEYRCLADWNASGGGPDSSDFLAYLNDWSAHAPRADLAPSNSGTGTRGDGTWDSSDFLAYLNLFVAGCP
ncbi:MAG: GC-type dockerin domain-anchored protein [Phycisphaerales bacterium]|nr:GC-type dockerin domain-anchored protein [Phycisphaerales bacterium]